MSTSSSEAYAMAALGSGQVWERDISHCCAA